MSDLDLMRALAAATAALAAPDARPAAMKRLLATVAADAGLGCSLGLSPGGLRVTWHGEPTPSQRAFVDVLDQVVTLALAVSAQASDDLLDRAGFLAAVERAVSAARWRGGRLSVAVFDVQGLTLGPGIDESAMVARVGALARSAVRHNDVVGHLGAARFALLMPGGGSFEARAAFKRVRGAVAASGAAPAEAVECGVAGFAELDGDAGNAAELLRIALERQADARRRAAYKGPVDPLRPLAG